VSAASTVVEVGLTVAGDVNSFGEAQQASLRASLRESLSCQEPACFLTLRVSAASVNVAAILAIPDPPAGSSTAAAATAAVTAAAVEAAATALAAQPAADISASLGVQVTAAAPVAIGHAVVPIVVAPPPPSPPPTLPPPTPPPPESPPTTLPSPPPAMLPSDQTPSVVASPSPPMRAIEGSDTQSQTADGALANIPTTMLLVAGGVGLLFVLLLAALVVRVCRSRQRAKGKRGTQVVIQPHQPHQPHSPATRGRPGVGAAAGVSNVTHCDFAGSSSQAAQSESRDPTTGINLYDMDAKMAWETTV